MQMTVETITPQTAASLLDYSAGNRTLKAAKVASYARDMSAGKWSLNGETIIFDEAGQLIDGHHRLRACITSGKPFQSVIVRGAAENVRQTIDMGSSRTLSDVLSFEGEKNGGALVSAINAAVSIKQGRPRSANLSSTELLDFIEAHPYAREYVSDGIRKSAPRIGAVICGLGIVAHYLGKQGEYAEFVNVLKSGMPSRQGCPAHVLRERMMRDAACRQKMPLQEAHRITVAAWNKFCAMQSVSFLRATAPYCVAGWTDVNNN